MRSKLVVGILLSIAVLLAAGEMITFAKIKNRLYREFDRNLGQRALSLTSFIEQTGDELEVDWLERGKEPPGGQKGIDYYQLWEKETGNTLLASEGLGETGLPRFGGPVDRPESRVVTLPGKRPGRCAGIEFHAQLDLALEADDDEEDAVEETGGAKMTEATAAAHRAPEAAPGDSPAQGALLQLVVATVDTVAPTLAGIRKLMFALWAGCSLLSGVIIWHVVRWSLAPLNRLEGQIRRLKDTVSGQRVHLENPPAELVPVTDELNRLLERVEGALDRERTLTSNVAHELRTPISGLLSTLEVTLSKNRHAMEYRESSEECFEIAKRMHWLVNNLLSITRIEAGNVQLQNQVVVLEESLPEWWAPFAQQAAERHLKVVWAIEPGAKLETDPEFLRVILTNLYDNAVCYALDGGTIKVHADRKGHLIVGNDAVDVSEVLVAHAFDPLWRRTEAREEVGSHAGLGLSLCQKIVLLLGGRIRAKSRETADWFEVQVEWA